MEGIGAGMKRSGGRDLCWYKKGWGWDWCWYKKELGVEGIGAGISRGVGWKDWGLAQV